MSASLGQGARLVLLCPLVNKPTAVIDKSLFQEICALESGAAQDSCWNVLLDRYQLVIPVVMVEEVLVNAVVPGRKDKEVIKTMCRELLRFQSCWMDDVHEIAFAELVDNRPLQKLPAPSEILVARMLGLQLDDPDLVEWVTQRKLEKEETARNWKAAQDSLLPSSDRVTVSSEKEFFDRTSKREFLIPLQDPSRRLEMLETILGGKFRLRHPHAADRTDAAFKAYGPDNFLKYPHTLNCLTARLAYFFAPLVAVERKGQTQPKYLLKRGEKHQRNNIEDEQYLISALVCDRLLTRDEGLANMGRTFSMAKAWNGETRLVNPSRPVEGELTAMPK